MTKPFKPWAFPANAIHVALDLETASLESNAAIVQLAAVCNNPSYQEFNIRISLVSNEIAGRHISKETMEWWDIQDSELRKKVFGGTDGLPEAMAAFHQWANEISMYQLDRIVLWGNGTEFDNVILQNAFEQFATWPFHYRNAHHLRTLLTTVPQHVQEYAHNLFIEHNPGNVQHDALHDARYQHAMVMAGLKHHGIH
jgi:3' exoribonuclease, RNase T-like